MELDVDGKIILNVYLKETDYDEVNWIHLAQSMMSDRL
jgi:hypothetical protein